LTVTYHPLITPPTSQDVKRAARLLAPEVRGVVASALPDGQRPDSGESDVASGEPSRRAPAWSISARSAGTPTLKMPSP